MKEALLHFVWRYQLIHHDKLETTKGEKIQILKVGTYNTNETADFLEAKICINGMVLFGNIEIHINSSDWKKHQHHQNKKYNNVILHVVYNDDEPVEHLPTLELNGKISPYLLNKYNLLMTTKYPIPCRLDWTALDGFTKTQLQDTLIVERLESKKKQILNLLTISNNDWLQTKYTLLLKYFGGHVSQFGFQELAARIDYKLLIKHADNLLQIEALLFGTAGFLEDGSSDDYFYKLKKEFQYLKVKYGIIPLKKQIWNFLRMRPASFPTIKLALLAKLIYTSPQLFQMQQAQQTKDFLATIKASNYWTTHYTFEKPSKYMEKQIGKSSINSLLINYSIPLYYTYQTEFENNDVLQNCIDLYESLPLEVNHKVRYFNVEPKNQSALTSQVLIELFDNYCVSKKCLDCRVGYQLIKNNSTKFASIT